MTEFRIYKCHFLHGDSRKFDASLITCCFNCGFLKVDLIIFNLDILRILERVTDNEHDITTISCSICADTKDEVN